MRPRLECGRRIRWTENTTATTEDTAERDGERETEMERERERTGCDGRGRKKKDGGKLVGFGGVLYVLPGVFRPFFQRLSVSEF